MSPEPPIQLWNAEPGTPTSEVLTLNDRLEEIEHKVGAPKGDCFPRNIYRMPDQSYVLFGSTMHSHSAEIHAVVAHVDGNLRTVRMWEPFSDAVPFVDFGRLDASTPAADPQTFLIAMGVIPRGLNNNPSGKHDVPPDFIRGADLNFVQISKKEDK